MGPNQTVVLSSCSLTDVVECVPSGVGRVDDVAVGEVQLVGELRARTVDGSAPSPAASWKLGQCPRRFSAAINTTVSAFVATATDSALLVTTGLLTGSGVGPG